MKTLPIALFLSFVSSLAAAVESNPVGVGVDFALPLTLMVDGNGTHDRENLNMGIEGRHWFTDQMNYGIRFHFDVEEKGGTARKAGMTPGYAHHWMPLENWRPFIRLDLPILFRGAANNAGSRSKADFGISGGAGFGWRIGDALGLPGMEFTYDFDLFWFFGAGDAVPVVGLDLFRAGFHYRF
jgi:hypothetical protein